MSGWFYVYRLGGFVDKRMDRSIDGGTDTYLTTDPFAEHFNFTKQTAIRERNQAFKG